MLGSILTTMGLVAVSGREPFDIGELLADLLGSIVDINTPIELHDDD